MDHLYSSLFLDMMVSPVINKVKTEKDELKAQLLRFRSMNIENYFILGK